VVLRGRLLRRDHSSGKADVIQRPNLLRGEDLPSEPRQQRSLEKRARLKEAALACFGENGYEATSIDDIASRAKLAVGGFYLHFRSKRQLLVTLMDELLEKLSQLDLRPRDLTDVRAALRELLRRSFSHDLRYLGAYRAWQEAVPADLDLLEKNEEIHAWTSARVTALFKALQQLPGARPGVDVAGLARVMDNFFWSLLARAGRLPRAELNRSIDSATHLIYHALFLDPHS
jgi:AcrR family transcriptional regulator